MLSDGLFFDDANTNPDTIVLGKPEIPFVSIRDRKLHLAWVANRIYQVSTPLRQSVYGVVPIMNHWTEPDIVDTRKQKHPTDGSLHIVDTADWREEICYIKKHRGRLPPTTPRSPLIPTKDEVKQLGGLMLCQIGFSTGRQGIFQALATSKSGTQLKDMIGQYVVIAQDVGMDIGVLRAIELLDALEPIKRGSEDVCFAPITRLAYPHEIAQLPQKAKDEAKALAIAQDLLVTKYPKLAEKITVDHCEFQFDRNKLIPYMTMPGFEDFSKFVNDIYKEVDNQLSYHCRVFCQRDVKNKDDNSAFARKHLLPPHLQRQNIHNG